MRLFVTGASGFIGSAFCRLAIAEGHQVVGLVRPASSHRVVPGVQRKYGTLPYDIPHGAMDGCDVIVHLAAITTADRSGETEAVNATGTEMILARAADVGAAVVFVSTQSAHGGNNSAYATTKRRGEELVKGFPHPWVIMRPGLVYGPGPTGLYARMRSMVAKLPVLPLLGGGKAIVQPIHVDDLARALLAAAKQVKELSGEEFNLGDPEGLELKEFLKKIARAQGRGGRSVTIPLGPVKAFVGLSEAMRLPVPISSDNLRGLETVVRMDTQGSLQRLGIKLRDLDEGIQQSGGNGEAVTDDRIPILLVGAGKIGIIHGIQITQNPATRLAGIVEPNTKAVKLYQSMGFTGPYYGCVDEAMSSQANATAAVVATPAFTHLDIARQCLEQGLHLLVEKPLSVSQEQVKSWQMLIESYPEQVLQAGYMAAQFPQLLTAFHAARNNVLGAVKAAKAIALQTHITAPEPVRWEMLKAKAGGGAMINFGCHVASILFRLLGWPETSAHGWQWKIYSEEVEDALIAQFKIKGIPCQLLVSWSVAGFARPQNIVELECENGRIRVENFGVIIEENGKPARVETQLDAKLDFNMAPDYTGGAFTLELESFAGAVSARQNGSVAGHLPRFMPPVEAAEALRLESWIYTLYSSLAHGKPPIQSALEANYDPQVLKQLLAAGASG